MHLLITKPDGTYSTINLESDTVSLGRARDNTLAYPNDPALSRYHLCLEPAGKEWFISDCGSRNGTLVNDALLTAKRQIRPGDRIYAGQLIIEVRESVAAAAAAANVVTFVPQDAGSARKESTIVTSLDEVLGQARHQTSESPLHTARGIKALLRAGQELAGHRPLEELFEVILDLALSAIDAKRGVILTAEKGELVTRASRGDRFTISTSVRDRVIRDRSALLISDAQFDSGFRKQESIIMQRVRSVMAVPLQTGDAVIGLIYVDNGTILRPFSQNDLELLTVMANVAAVRIEHGRLAAIEQQEKLTQSELAQASEIQAGLLPGEPPALDGYELAGFNLPCRAVGGDYYDFLSYRDGRLGLFVADVCGKGLPAALLMSSLAARVQMLLESELDAAAALNVVNRSIAKRCPLGRFITAFYGLLEPATGRLEYANAGHNYPLIARANGSVERLPGANLVMGLFENVEYAAHDSTLERGDLLLLYSDGVTDATTGAGVPFGEEGLMQFLRAHREENCTQVISSLVDHVRSQSRDSVFSDDFTVLLARRN
jgi:phosphoserine phosphatase RsbU/P